MVGIGIEKNANGFQKLSQIQHKFKLNVYVVKTTDNFESFKSFEMI